jgi:hypothetical protein
MGLKQRIIEFWDRIRLVLVAVMTALVLLFAVQNLHAVRIDVVFWQLVVGGVVSFYYKGRFWSERKARKRALADKAAAEEKAAAAQLPPPSAPEEPAAAEREAAKRQE